MPSSTPSASAATVTTASAATSAITTTTASAPAVITTVCMIIPSFSSITHIALTTDEIGIEISLRQHFTFTDPNLDPDLSIYSLCEHIGIVDIHSECMQR